MSEMPAPTHPPRLSSLRLALVYASVAFWLCLIIFGGIQLNRVNQALSHVEARLNVLDISSEFGAGAGVETPEAQATLTQIEAAENRAILARIEAAENRVLGQLANFDAIANAITLLGLLIASVGVLAVVLGVQDYRSALQELEQAKRTLADEQTKLREAREASQAVLINFRTTTQKANLAQSLLHLAEQQYRANNIEGTLKTYDRAITLDNANPILHYHRGYLLTQTNDLPEAEVALKKALQYDPDLPQAKAALGFVYRRIGEGLMGEEQEAMFETAEEWLMSALRGYRQLVDDDGESWWGVLGGLAKRRYEITNEAFYLGEALRYYRLAKDITPQSSYPVINIALLSLENGSSAELRESFQRVEELARRKIQAEVQTYWPHADLLHASLVLGACEQAVDSAKTLSDILPDGVADVLPRVIYAVAQIQQSPVLKESAQGNRCPDSVFDEVFAILQARQPGASLDAQLKRTVDNPTRSDDTETR